MSVTMSYGDYNFSPVPFLEISKNYIKSSNGQNIGTSFVATLTGTITADLNDIGLQSSIEKKRLLREAFNKDGKYFQITCDGQTLIESYPRITDISFTESNNNWVMTIPYSITLEYENDKVNVNITGFGEDNPDLHPEYISDFQESWNVEFSPDTSNPYSLSTQDTNPYLARVTHNINAVGKSHYSKPSVGHLTGELDMPAWQQARNYINQYLGFDESVIDGLVDESGNETSLNWLPYDHYRTNTRDESQGAFGVQESWLIIADRSGLSRKAVEDFNINVQVNHLQEYNFVSIDGTIRGLEERSYGLGDGSFTIDSNKYDNALSYWNSLSGLIQSRVTTRASLESITLNTDPITTTIGHNPNQGTVTYNFSYNDRPTNCISGAKFESITVSDSNPTDVFAAIPILGRPQGPILQSFNTVTEFRRSVNVEVLVDPIGCSGTSPKLDVETVLASYYSDLTGLYDKVYKDSDNENWTPTNGRYSRNVSWTAVDCDTSPTTTF